MLDYLSHNEAPISDEQWDGLDKMVIEVARRQLVGRRFIGILGPLGAGIQWIAQDRFDGSIEGTVDNMGEDSSSTVIRSTSRTNLLIPTIYKDFIIYWRDVEASRKFNIPLDLSAAAIAASACAYAEDQMIFKGYQNKDEMIDYPGLLTVPGRLQLKPSNWEEPGAVFNDVIKATEALVTDGFYAPYAMVASPKTYSKIHRYMNNSGVMEIEYIRQIITQGVYFSSVIPENQILVVATGVQNFDLAIAQDFKTAYLGATNMNHPFRVLETIVLRIKRPGSICVIEGPQ
ncbi:MAG: bacteriocin family protein [Cyanobacteria bacterium]|nr:bacteriocin family protein [Cyanobacteriota bacterium]